MSKRNTSSVLQEFQNIIQQKNSQLLSPYKNTTTPVTIRCDKGHTFNRKPHEILYMKRWCQICRTEERGFPAKYTIEDAHKIAKLLDGRCLSTFYIDNKQKLEFECVDKHPIFLMSLHDVMVEKSWCPKCHDGFYIGEEICRKIFETVTGQIFTKVKPEWLINDKGNKMEIDGYCDKLKIGFEYQGHHHYSEMYYRGSKDAKERLKKRVKNDALKLELAQKQGITIIQVPYTLTKEEQVVFIVSKLKEKNIDLVCETVKHDEMRFIKSSKLKKMCDVAESKGYVCLAKSYLGSSEKYPFLCKKHGEFQTQYNEFVNNNSGCPTCAREGNAKKCKTKWGVYLKLQTLCKDNGLSLLTPETEYMGAQSYVKLGCKKNSTHQWPAKTYSVKQGLIKGHYQCKFCIGLAPLTLEDAITEAKKHNGKCLSQTYENNRTPMLFECEFGQKFLMRLSDVKRGHWCKCSNCRSKKIEN